MPTGSRTRETPAAAAIRTASVPAPGLSEEIRRHWWDVEHEFERLAPIRKALGELDHQVAEYGFVRGVPRSVCLSAADFRQHGRKMLDAWPALTHVSLSNCDGHVPSLGSDSTVGRLRELNLEFDSYEYDGHAALLARHADRLQSIGMTGCALLGTDGLQRFLRQDWLRQLTRLDLSGNRFGAFEMAEALYAAPLDTLKQLDLGGNGFTEKGLRMILAAPWMGRVEELSLSGSRGPKVFESIDHVDPEPAFRALCLRACSLNISKLRNWKDLRGSRNLERLDLGLNDFRPRDMDALAEVDWLQRLTRLSLEHTHLVDRDFLKFADAGAFDHLEDLNIERCNILRAGLDGLAGLGTGLVSLKLDVSLLNARGLMALLESHHGRSLRRLHLTVLDRDGNSALSAETVEALASRLQHTAVEELVLRVPRCGAWLSGLSRGEGMPALKKLVLEDRTRFGEPADTVQPDELLPLMPGVLDLTLSTGNFGDAEMRRLAAILPMSGLRKLSLRPTAVSDEALVSLFAASSSSQVTRLHLAGVPLHRRPAGILASPEVFPKLLWLEVEAVEGRDLLRSRFGAKAVVQRARHTYRMDDIQE